MVVFGWEKLKSNEKILPDTANCRYKTLRRGRPKCVLYGGKFKELSYNWG
jgi:hypothetical protein